MDKPLTYMGKPLNYQDIVAAFREHAERAAEQFPDYRYTDWSAAEPGIRLHAGRAGVKALRAILESDHRSANARERAERNTGNEWAAWAIETREGFTPPEGAVVQVNYEGVAQFHTKSRVQGYWDRSNLPRKSRSKGVWVESHDEYTPVGPAIVVPPHCRVVKRIDLWELALAAGLPAARCYEIANPWGRQDAALRALARLEEAKGLAALVAQPAAFLAALEAIQAEDSIERAARDAQYRQRRQAEWPETVAATLRQEDGTPEAACALRARRYGPGSLAGYPRACRADWMELAKHGKSLEMPAADIAGCVARARGFHRLAMQEKRRDAERQQAIEAAKRAAETAAVAAAPVKARKPVNSERVRKAAHLAAVDALVMQCYPPSVSLSMAA